jgi:hypothetical protein
LQLLETAEAFDGEKSILQAKVTDLDRKVNELQSDERREAFGEAIRVLRVIAYFIGFTALVVGLERFTSLRNRAVVIIVTIFLGFILFLDGRLASALVKWKGGSVDIKSNKRGAR